MKRSARDAKREHLAKKKRGYTRRGGEAIQATRVYRLRELPALLQVGPKVVREEIRAGRLVPTRRQGVRMLFLGSELLRWVTGSSLRTPGTPGNPT